MSTDSSQVYVRSTQKRALRIALVIAVVLLVILTPLLLSGSLRLDLAHRFDLAPGSNVERVADADSGQILIVIPIIVPVSESRDEIRFHAAYLAEPRNGHFILTSLDTDSTLTVPLAEINFIAADPTGEYVLLREDTGLNSRSVLVAVSAGTVSELAEGQDQPDIPGDWDRSIFATRMGRTCLGISPQQTYIACFESPAFARFLAGDWQIDVQRFGDYRMAKEIFRGLGSQPVFGFNRDESWLYFQNETGIWREPVSLDMFEE